MSGPKSSNYYLSAQQRAIIAQQQRREQERQLELQRRERERQLQLQRIQREREEEQRRVRKETEAKNNLLKSIADQKSAIAGQMKRIDQLLNESGKSGADAKMLKDALAKAEKAASDVRKVTPERSADIHRQNERLRAILQDISEIVSSSSALASALGSSYRTELDATIQKGFSLSFAGIGQSKKERSVGTTMSAKDDLEEYRVQQERISALLAQAEEDIPSPMHGQLQEIRRQMAQISDAEYMRNFGAVVVTPFVKACTECKDYDDVRARYELLAAQARITAVPFGCTADGIRAMQEANARMEEQILADRERSYINEALDAVMKELGYELVGDRTQVKKTGKRVRHELYSLREGTAVDVTFAENGQITMELGGMAHSDRQPNAEEIDQLVQDMHSFCSDYAEVERRLAERGVLMGHISHMPPSAEHAQIINVNDYHLVADAADYEIKRERKQGTEHRYQSQSRERFE